VRVFLDTNVLASAFGTRGLCADLVRVVFAEHELVTSETVLSELRNTLRAKFGVPETVIEEVLALLSTGPVQPTPQPPLPVAVRDPDDRLILAAALEAGADVLVTGDKDLLALKGQVAIPITTPRGFWESLKRKNA
jgi:putative PIN family toxin of toxin-antitoxin system